jgi:hypothetical protein
MIERMCALNVTVSGNRFKWPFASLALSKATVPLAAVESGAEGSAADGDVRNKTTPASRLIEIKHATRDWCERRRSKLVILGRVMKVLAAQVFWKVPRLFRKMAR